MDTSITNPDIDPTADLISTRITPRKHLDILSHLEVERLRNQAVTDTYEMFRCCALAVLNTGSHIDDANKVYELFKNFSLELIQQERGIKLELTNAPSNAFVDGEMIEGIREHVFSTLRDIVYTHNELKQIRDIDFDTTEGITNAVFHILRNAGAMRQNIDGNLVVCWGGHSINDIEYDYAKKVGYEMGLRRLDICTGCGPGAMKAPMKGATYGHAKQRFVGRYIGISEPGIIAAESPNAIVNQLIIMPDIEKRLESFVRLGHGIIVFPGGVGTAEEILYILGILMHEKNKDDPYPLIFTGPKEAASYFEQIDEFIGVTLGKEAQAKYQIIINDPVEVARVMKSKLDEVMKYRRQTKDAYYYNWVLHIDQALQTPFKPTHESMRNLNLHPGQSSFDLAVNLRKAFSGIVDGNVKENGVKAVAKHGPYELDGDRAIIDPLSRLLESFVEQNRMKISTSEYKPCYTILKA